MLTFDGAADYSKPLITEKKYKKKKALSPDMGKCTPVAKMRPYINKLELRKSLKTPISKAKYMILEEKVLSKEMQNIQNLL